MTPHRFEIGQQVRVSIQAALTFARRGIYTVVAVLPSKDPYLDVPQYRVRSDAEPYDRIVAGSQLIKADAEPESAPGPLA